MLASTLRIEHVAARLQDIAEFVQFFRWLWHMALYAIATFDVYGAVGLLIVIALIVWVVLRWLRRF
jgi:hypothetical protein